VLSLKARVCDFIEIFVALMTFIENPMLTPKARVCDFIEMFVALMTS